MKINLSIVDIKHNPDSICVSVQRSDTGGISNIAVDPHGSRQDILNAVSKHLAEINGTSNMVGHAAYGAGFPPEKKGLFSRIKGLFSK